MMHNLVLSILAAAQIGGVGVTKPEISRANLPVVKSVGFGGTARMIARGGGGTVGGQEADGWVELSAPAPCVEDCGTYVNGKPAGGMFVQVSSSNPAVAKVQPVTGRILVPVGQIRTTFTVLTSGVSTPTPVTISAWREGSPPQTTTLYVVPPSLMGLAIDQASVTGGIGAHGSVTFNGTPASAGAVRATLSSSNPAAVQVPPSVPLDVNKTVATFDIKTFGVASSTPVTVTASYGGRQPTVSLTVTPAVITKFDYYGLELNGPAPPGGAVITLSSADPAHSSVPATVTIPAGGTKVGVTITHHCDQSAHNVQISATYKSVVMKYNDYVFGTVKPDLAIKDVKLIDRFGNAITHPQDAQPYKACVTIELLHTNTSGAYLYPVSTVLHVSYLTPTGGGTSAGHEFDVPISFPLTTTPCGGFTATTLGIHGDDSTAWFDPPTCIDMPGLPQPGNYTDVTLVVDPNNKNDESNPGNNTKTVRITRQ